MNIQISQYQLSVLKSRNYALSSKRTLCTSSEKQLKVTLLLEIDRSLYLELFDLNLNWFWDHLRVDVLIKYVNETSNRRSKWNEVNLNWKRMHWERGNYSKMIDRSYEWKRKTNRKRVCIRSFKQQSYE